MNLQEFSKVGRCSLPGWSWDWRPDDDRFVEARLGLIALLNSTWARMGDGGSLGKNQNWMDHSGRQR